MKYIFYISLILFFCSTAASGQQQMQSGEIIVEINTLKSHTGLARVSLYNSNDGFPIKSKKAFKTIVINLEKGAAKAIFPDIPYGEYAVAILHDENKNGRMDFSWRMLPDEGFGASNMMEKQFIPPAFKDAKFVFQSEEKILKVLMHY